MSRKKKHPTEQTSVQTPSKKAALARRYRERKKLTDPEYLKRELERTRKYYRPVSSLNQKELEERRKIGAERLRRWRLSKKSGESRVDVHSTSRSSRNRTQTLIIKLPAVTRSPVQKTKQQKTNLRPKVTETKQQKKKSKVAELEKLIRELKRENRELKRENTSLRDRCKLLESVQRQDSVIPITAPVLEKDGESHVTETVANGLRTVVGSDGKIFIFVKEEDIDETYE